LDLVVPLEPDLGGRSRPAGWYYGDDMDAAGLSQDRFVPRVNGALAALAAVIALVDAEGTAWPWVLVMVCGFLVRALFPRVAAMTVTVVVLVSLIGLNLHLRSEGAFFFACLATVDVVATEPRRKLAYGCGLAALLLPLVIRVTGDQGARNNWRWQFWSAGVLLSGVLGWSLHRQYRLTEALRAAHAQLTGQAIAQERRRIAREVHDLVGHTLTVVMLHVTGARHTMRRDPDEAEAALREAEAAGRRSLAEIRQVIGLLREGDDDDTRHALPIGRDIGELIERYRSGGLDAAITIAGDLDRTDAITGLAVFRIVQESLSNVVRHAPGASAAVAVGIDDDCCDISVTNAIAAGPGPGQPGNGITGMNERATSLGGTLHAGPVDKSSTWQVHARIPLRSIA
jgi:signal transduction histidine kinase